MTLTVILLGEAHWLKAPTLARHHGTNCMSCFTRGGPAKEHRTNKLPPPTGRVQERSKEDITCPTTSQNPSHWHPSSLNKVCTTRKDSESEWLAKDYPETNPITIKPKTASHVAELFSWVPLPYCSPPGCPFPIKSLALSAHVSSWTIHFRVLDKSPVSGPGRGPTFCNNMVHILEWWRSVDQRMIISGCLPALISLEDFPARILNCLCRSAVSDS